MRWRNQNKFDGEIAVAHKTFPTVPPTLIKAFIATESAFNPDAERGETRGRKSIGLMQLLLGTARGVGYGGPEAGLFLTAPNVYFGTAELARLIARYGGDLDRAISAYNGGDRPRFGFGTPVTKPTTVCLQRNAETGECERRFTAQPGEFGNQAYVDRVRAMKRYFETGQHAGAVLPLLLMVGGALLWRFL